MKKFNLSEKIAANVRGLSPYTPGEQPSDGGWVKLNTNELPYPPSPRVREAVMAEIGVDGANLRLYPDPCSRALRKAAAEYYGLSGECAFAANGSDDALNLAIRAFSDSNLKIATIDPSYSLYPVLAEMQGSEIIEIPFENLEIPYEKIFASGANIFFFTNPNAPTGKGFGLDAVARLCENFDGIVLVDEAYAPFAEQSATALVEKYDNLIVLGTSSKGWGLAGMRIGWAFAQPALIEVLDRVRDSYNLDRLAQAAGVAALGDKAYHLECVRKVVEERAATEKFFDEIGWKYVKSSSNFILFEPSRADMPPSAAAAASLFEFLRSKKILLRYFAKSENVNKSIRLTVGTPEQMKAFKAAALQWKEGIK